MGDSSQLVMQYFFMVGAGLGLGLVVTVGGSYVVYKKIKGVSFGWLSTKKSR